MMGKRPDLVLIDGVAYVPAASVAAAADETIGELVDRLDADRDDGTLAKIGNRVYLRVDPFVISEVHQALILTDPDSDARRARIATWERLVLAMLDCLAARTRHDCVRYLRGRTASFARFRHDPSLRRRDEFLTAIRTIDDRPRLNVRR